MSRHPIAASQTLDAEKRVREIVTPEGLPLRIELASRGARAGAFMIDALIVVAALVLVSLLSLGAAAGAAAGLKAAFVMVAAFAIRNAYFATFELAWAGATPGKRAMKLRVVGANARPLTYPAVLARNVSREVELFVPVSVIVAPDTLWPGAPGWALPLAIVWALILLGFPLFNREHARVGDLLAGTRVIRVPEPVLLPDVGEARPHAPAPAHAFSREELEAYGIYELQVLRKPESPDRAPTIAAVAGRIRRKIGRPPPDPADPEAFLEAYYRALRGHLERQALFGRRRADKYAAKGG